VRVVHGSRSGIQLSLDDWLSAGTMCDLRITTHTGRMIHRAAYPRPGLITLFDDDVPKGRGDGES